MDYLKKLGKKGKMASNSIIGALILIIIAVALIPVIQSQIDSANLSTSVRTLLTLTPLLVGVGVLSFIAYTTVSTHK